MRVGEDGNLVIGEFGAERGFVFFCHHELCPKEATHDYYRHKDHGEFFSSRREWYCEEHAPKGSNPLEE